MSKDGQGSSVPRVFTHGVKNIVDTTMPEQPTKPTKEAVGKPDHEFRMPGPGGDTVITQNMHKQHSATPDYTSPAPSKAPPTLPNHEQSKEISRRDGRPGYAGQSFREATRPNGRPR